MADARGDGSRADARRSSPLLQIRSRQTGPFGLVWSHLTETERFRSAQEIHGELRTAGKRIGLTTVYGALKDLERAGVVHSVSSGREKRYRFCRGEQHHHHLVCRSCGIGIEVDSAVFERYVDEVGRAHGYSDIEHRLELFGYCSVCSSREGR